jgi:hypothetical protein
MTSKSSFTQILDNKGPMLVPMKWKILWRLNSKKKLLLGVYWDYLGVIFGFLW